MELCSPSPDHMFFHQCRVNDRPTPSLVLRIVSARVQLLCIHEIGTLRGARTNFYVFQLFSHGFSHFLAIFAWFFTVFKVWRSDSGLFQLVSKRFRSVSTPRIAFQHSESHFHTHKTPTQHSKTRPQHSETPKISNFAHQIVSILE